MPLLLLSNFINIIKFLRSGEHFVSGGGDKILKLWGYGKNQPQDGEKSISLIQQFFGGGVEGAKPLIQSMDEIILQKRKERGLKTENK